MFGQGETLPWPMFARNLPRQAIKHARESTASIHKVYIQPVGHVQSFDPRVRTDNKTVSTVVRIGCTGHLGDQLL